MGSIGPGWPLNGGSPPLFPDQYDGWGISPWTWGHYRVSSVRYAEGSTQDQVVMVIESNHLFRPYRGH